MEIHTAKPTDDRKMLLAGSLSSLATGILATDITALEPRLFWDFNESRYSSSRSRATIAYRFHRYRDLWRTDPFLFKKARLPLSLRRILTLPQLRLFYPPAHRAFSQFENPHGTRDYRENSSSISKYISREYPVGPNRDECRCRPFSKHRNIDLAIILMPCWAIACLSLRPANIRRSHLRIRRSTPLSIQASFLRFWGLAFIANCSDPINGNAWLHRQRHRQCGLIFHPSSSPPGARRVG